jgi:hypothetical protein
MFETALPFNVAAIKVLEQDEVAKPPPLLYHHPVGFIRGTRLD